MNRNDALSMSSIHYMPLPATVYGVCKACENGRYLIAINCTISKAAQAKALEHELMHICLNHFNTDKDIRTIETEAGGF